MVSAILKLGRQSALEASVARGALLGAQAVNIPTLRQSTPGFSAELRRARRYEHPLALAVLGLGDWSFAGGNGRSNGDGAHRHPSSAQSAHQVFFLLGSLLCDTLRETDLVSYSTEDHLFVVMLPEVGESEARQAARRLYKLFYDRVSIPLRVGVAEFPRDGLTVGDLIDRARTAWRRRSELDLLPVEPVETANA